MVVVDFFIVLSWQNKTLAIPCECGKVCVLKFYCAMKSQSLESTALYNVGISEGRAALHRVPAMRAHWAGWFSYITSDQTTKGKSCPDFTD